MKNRELLPVGTKPAPGDLAFVQGFINLLGVVQKRRDLDGVKVLKTWLVRHGLLNQATSLNKTDLKAANSLSNALHGLLVANNGAELDKKNVTLLNRLISSYNLTVKFQPDGTAQLHPKARGLEKALGKLLTVVINSMTEGSWERLKACREPKCGWTFYDSSKNKSGRWCSMSVCGARLKARAYRKRQKHI